ncbi:Bacillopeptidase F [Aquicella siphonis]|uniref:Bacillopeptidase F n=1 Tax=Aquicella siphonis TaxID=254247 RepID=A0A5E4PGM1_9COXI|nr:S8 family serine peptidase [Aquicella siphonis]VVC75503.1 Bacillopeptidase F [Aquicella siphonis]
MNIKQILLSLGIISVMGSQGIQASTLTLNPKIDKYVQKQLTSRQQVKNSVFVILTEQADLSAADSLASREEKGRYVYDTLRNKALATQGPLVDFLQSRKVSFRQYYIENMIAVENPSAELINELAARADVARIMGNPLVKLKLPKTKNTFSLASTPSSTGPEQNLVRIGATKVWENYKVRGEGIVVAGQDTGVQWDHPALKRQYRGTSATGTVDHNYNWHDAIHSQIDTSAKASVCGYDSKVPCDDVGHGTHTMGTIVGDDGKGNQIGVAPKAQWMACKNMDNGVGTPASYIECFEFFLAPYPLNGNPLKDGDPAKAPHIINNSWGCTADEGCKGDEILPSLKSMKKAGILVVASAGNEGPGCATIDAPPAWHSGLTLAVGAFDHRSDNIAYFSSRGPSAFDGGTGPNIAAPGVSIRSSVPGSRYESAMWSGTSMAGPHAVGAAALLWSFNKNLIGNIDQTISLLEKSAEPKTTRENCGGLPGSHIPNNTYGSGLLNVAQAVCSMSDHCAA